MHTNDADQVPQCCASCRFYRRVEEDETDGGDELSDEVGRCVRYPPQFFYSKLLNAEFPVTSAGTWCGEYERNPDV